MTVAVNMAVIVRLEDPFRLSRFRVEKQAAFRKEKTTDAARGTENTPDIELVDELHIPSGRGRRTVEENENQG